MFEDDPQYYQMDDWRIWSIDYVLKHGKKGSYTQNSNAHVHVTGHIKM